jgi:hypothetical protein
LKHRFLRFVANAAAGRFLRELSRKIAQLPTKSRFVNCRIEIAEGGTHRLLTLHHTEMEAASSEGPASNPHTHFEIADGNVPTTVAPMFASGGQYAKESFRLHVVAVGSGFPLVGYSPSAFGLSSRAVLESLGINIRPPDR